MTSAGAPERKTAPASRRCRTVFLALAAALVALPATADEFRTPPISVVRPDWSTAAAQLKAEVGAQPSVAGHFSFASGFRTRPGAPRSVPALAQLDAVTSAVFPGIARSPVPVLLPFDAALYLADGNGGAPGRYQSGFSAAMFDAGPAGYDAVFMLDPDVRDGLLARAFKKPVEIQITGSLLTYDIDDPLAGKGQPVKALAAQYPDLRRVIREGYVRYAFTRFDAPYVVSIYCRDGPPRGRRLSCREASGVAERFLKALRVAGGTPQAPRFHVSPEASERPAAHSPDFTYRPPGEIITNSGYRGQSGHADPTVYAQIRFPIEKAPAFANSQSFLNWGDCYRTGRLGWRPVKGDDYRCKRNDRPLVFDESAKENYSYPWQDNFCETRDFEVGQCANGMGHQGQDIRPSSCLLRNDGADRCLPDIHSVVAVRDGVVIRGAGQQSVYLVVNGRNEHVRFRYMHMNPARLDADGVLHGRRVAEGERIGTVSNYQDRPGGTTSHLHFDAQVFTRDGWLWVNPYVTLISAYERLIGGRGREYAPPSTGAPAVAHAPADGATRDDVR